MTFSMSEMLAGQFRLELASWSGNFLKRLSERQPAATWAETSAWAVSLPHTRPHPSLAFLSSSSFPCFPLLLGTTSNMSFPQPYRGYPDAKYHKLTLAAEGVLLLSFNRPPVNAWIDPKWQELGCILRKVREDPDVAVIVVAGEGRCFTAGLDLTNQSLATIMQNQPDAARKALIMRSHLRDFQEAVSWFEYVEKPVIAAAHGVAFGLAIDIMSACDIRYATKDTRFSVKEVDAGLAADIGTLQRFPKIVGNDSLARELCYTAREFGATEAREIGFLSKVVDGGRQEVVGKYTMPCCISLLPFDQFFSSLTEYVALTIT